MQRQRFVGDALRRYHMILLRQRERHAELFDPVFLRERRWLQLRKVCEPDALEICTDLRFCKRGAA